MIRIVNKEDCCGCGACVQRCPKHAMSMIEDSEGFLYPRVDMSACIDCGICENVCLVANQNSVSTPLKIYAAKNKDIRQRELSSSGGLFIAIAKHVIADGGVVFGVVFDEQWEVHHVPATTIEDLRPMMRSKYVQSRTENTFAEAETFLKHGRKVMYVGTSCQIAGLKNFLRKDYPNLLAVDLICHGVPSPGVWRKYLREHIEKLSETARSAATGKNTVLNRSLKPMSVIADISFREKSRSGFDWQKYGFVVWKKSTNKGGQNSVLSSYRFDTNPFMRGFLGNIYLRPSCYRCPAKGGRSGADLTIADYWGIGNVRSDFCDNSGVGLAIVHTQKGLDVFNSIGFEVVETTLDEATASNSSYWLSANKPDCRQKFFRMMKSLIEVDLAVDYCLYTPLPVKILKKIIRKIKRILK